MVAVIFAALLFVFLVGIALGIQLGRIEHDPRGDTVDLTRREVREQVMQRRVW